MYYLSIVRIRLILDMDISDPGYPYRRILDLGRFRLSYLLRLLLGSLLSRSGSRDDRTQYLGDPGISYLPGICRVGILPGGLIDGGSGIELLRYICVPVEPEELESYI